ncbi:MAG: hypothetical protein Q8R55_01525 [Candidatus Taylorbacteria bacterium]|nr:hypothetical protein [Candidatus Taylorbacteria bacterium]
MFSGKVVLPLVLFFLVAVNAFSQFNPVNPVQFGKNNVRYNQLDQFYESHRFDVWHNLDPNDPAQMEYLRQVIDNLEGARNWMSGSKIFGHSIEKRIPIFFYKTHTDMESSNLVGGFMPEGVGAFVESGRKRMVLKADFSRPLGRAIGVHELVHEFQFDISSPNVIQEAVGITRLPNGYYEGCAEFLAGLYDPHTRDDIRRREQRNFAASPKTLPTWGALNNGTVNPYTMWSMIPEFLEDKFSGGVAFCTQPLKNKVRLGEFVYDLTKGELGDPDINSEKFDQHNRHYWGVEKGFELDRISRPKPYEENDNFKGWTVTPYGHPYPMLSPASDGTQIAAFTIQKNGVALVRYDIPRETAYLSKAEREKGKKGNVLKRLRLKPDPVKNLTPQLPPVPWVYLIVQGFETWPFNGFDLDWWQDPDWIIKVKDAHRNLENSNKMLAWLKNIPDKYKAKDHALTVKALEDGVRSFENDLENLKQIPDVNKIAFFARINRDHALVIIDAENGKILRKIELDYALYQLDQAFSPSFSPDGKSIYFSAVKDITRDIYRVDLTATGVMLDNYTKDERFDTAPSVSPDGTKIAYIGSDGDFQHLFMLDISNGIIEKEQLTFGEFNDSSPSWSDDGSTLVYVSDEADRIWNLYTLELATRTVSQWTNFLGEVKTPLFAKGSLNTVYYAVFHDDDQYRNNIYPNYEIFAAELKKPIRRYPVIDKGESNVFAFNPSRNLFSHQLDSNQLLNPKKPPENWGFSPSNLNAGWSPWGFFTTGIVERSNILETKSHIASFLSYGSFKDINYSYLNREKRMSRQWGAHYVKLPLYFQFFDFKEGYPKQYVLNRTWVEEFSANLSVQYPKNRFNRWELFSTLRHRSYLFRGISQTLIDENPNFFTPTDSEVFKSLDNSSGSSVIFGGAYVRDTVLYSGKTQGPFHGNAFRLQIEAAPPLGHALLGYTSVSVDARTYKHLSSGTLFAGRFSAVTTSRDNGEVVLMGGPKTLRGKPFGFMIGNQAAYASGELRFPFIDAILTPGGAMAVGPFRGLLFFDAGVAKFSDQRLPSQRETSVGGGIQFLPFNFLWTRENGKWRPSFYINMNW